MHTSLETTTNGGVELPWDVGGAEDKHACRVFSDTVHLDQHFGLNAARGLGFTLASGTAKGVDFVDEDDGGFVLARHVEELFDEPVKA